MTRIPNGRYFRWLVSQVRVEASDPPKDYSGLFSLLHNKEFVWIIPNDDNRVKDALYLRREYWENRGKPHLASLEGASVLEMMVALSRRVAFNSEGDPRDWVWTFIKNLELDKMYEPLNRRKAEKIDEILENLIFRQYERNGKGGLFPLEKPKEDQTQVELWYQMHAYIIENDLI